MENLGYLYSIAIAAGGVMGYVKKGKNVAFAISVCYSWYRPGGLITKSETRDKNQDNFIRYKLKTVSER